MPQPTEQTRPGPPRLCPVCAAPLIHEERHRVPVDVCEEHGIWLDRGELQEIIQRDWVQHADLDEERLLIARREGKMSGALFGWLSLLWDK
jgi:Zn-finger nucleic acid-binding protein